MSISEFGDVSRCRCVIAARELVVKCNEWEEVEDELVVDELVVKCNEWEEVEGRREGGREGGAGKEGERRRRGATSYDGVEHRRTTSWAEGCNELRPHALSATQ